MTSQTEPLRPFHLAFPVKVLSTTRHFYKTVLGYAVGRTADRLQQDQVNL